MEAQETIYIDSVFLLNLVMDMYLLLLTARVLGKTATFLRMIAGAAVGAAGYCIVLCVPGGSYAGKLAAGMLPVGLIMVKLTYREKRLVENVRILGYLYAFSFLLGGFMLFLKGKLLLTGIYQDSVLLLAGLGFLGYGLCHQGIRNFLKRRKDCFCQVKLEGDKEKLVVDALIDTGNGLVEPVSHKPVAILDEAVWEHMRNLMKPEKYRLIPYHSIGKEQGMLEGYMIDFMEVCSRTKEKRYEDVIIAIAKGKVSAKGSYQMLLPPELSV